MLSHGMPSSSTLCKPVAQRRLYLGPDSFEQLSDAGLGFFSSQTPTVNPVWLSVSECVSECVCEQVCVSVCVCVCVCEKAWGERRKTAEFKRTFSVKQLIQVTAVHEQQHLLQSDGLVSGSG